jgi:subtilisin family serine protease
VIDQLRTARIATVISSGNNSSSTGVSVPGCITTAITIGNTTKTDIVAGTSNSAAVVDLLAPGTSINSSVPGGGFAQMTGTSMAAPHVAGAIAVLRSIKNDLTVDQIEDILESTGVRLTDPKNNLSFPRLNLQAAVLNVSGLSGALAAGVQYVLSDSEGALLPPIVHYVLN